MTSQKKQRERSKKSLLEERLLEYKAASARLEWDMVEAIHHVLDEKDTKYIQ